MMHLLQDKVILTTGSNSGIGREICLQLAQHNAEVIVVCRTQQKTQETVEYIRSKYPQANLKTSSVNLDLSSNDSIKQFIKKYFKNKKINILVNNAGANLVQKRHIGQIKDIIQVNYLGPFYLTRLLLNNFPLNKEPCQVVNVSSVLHRFGQISNFERLFYKFSDKTQDYPNSKLAQVAFGSELERRVDNQNFRSYSVEPGFTNTGIYDSSKLFSGFPIKQLINFWSSPASDGAKVVVDAIVLELKKQKYGQEIVQDRPTFYARGIFACPIIAKFCGGGYDVRQNTTSFDRALNKIKNVFYCLGFCTATFDYRLRQIVPLQKFRIAQPTQPSQQGRDPILAHNLWKQSCKLLGLDENIQS